jgi:hypothetical protein
LVDVLGKVRYNTHIATKELTMRDEILAKLAEIEEMFASATCDKEPIEEGGTVQWELKTAMDALVERVDYYLD